jgi:hypothetical protein
MLSGVVEQAGQAYSLIEKRTSLVIAGLIDQQRGKGASGVRRIRRSGTLASMISRDSR